MLCEIKIENVAVIEKAAAVFSDGLNVLSGETGAGKSILIDSINAILGNRTSREIVRSHTPKAMIWATFRGIGAKTRAQLADAGYEAENELLLYREITAEGKSTCRINGMPATASVVRDICSGLINIHGQHDNQSLMNPARHLGILDSFAQNETAHDAYYVVYKELCRVKKEIDALSMDETEKERRIETLRFQIEEIGAAELRPGEEDELLNRRTLIRNAQTVTEQLNIAYAALSGAEDAPGAGEMLGSAATALESRIRTGFTENVYRVGNGIKEFFIGFVISLPILLVLAVGIIIAVIVIRLFLRISEKNNAKRAAGKRNAGPYYGPFGGPGGPPNAGPGNIRPENVGPAAGPGSPEDGQSIQRAPAPSAQQPQTPNNQKTDKERPNGS